MKAWVMAKVGGYWANLPAGDRRALTMAGIFLSVVFGYVYFVEPLLFRYDAAQAALTDLGEQERRYTRQVTMLARREAKLAEHRGELEALQNHFKLQTVSPEVRVSRSINELSYYARLANVQVTAVRPLELQQTERYVELPLEAEANGSFEALQRFFYYIDTAPSLLAITDIDLKAEESGPVQARLKLAAISRSTDNQALTSTLPTSSEKHLRLVVSHATECASLIVAQARGLLSTEDLFVDLLPVDDNVTAERLTLSGEMDGAVIGLPELLNLWVKGLPLKAVLPMAGSAGAEGLVVAAGADIKSLEDLRGREIAVDAQGSLQFVLMKALQTANLSLQDVKLRPLDAEQVVREIEGGTVQIGMTQEPYYSALLQRGQGKTLYSSEPLEGLLYDLLALTPDAISSKPKAVRALVAAVLQAQEFIHQKPEQAAELVAHWQGQSTATTAAGFRKLRFFDSSAMKSFVLDQRFAKALAELEVAYESWQQPFPLVVAQDLFAPQFVQEATRP